MTDKLPPALREARKPTHEEVVNAIRSIDPAQYMQAYGSRCMAAALRWARERVVCCDCCQELPDAIAALEQEAQ